MRCGFVEAVWAQNSWLCRPEFGFKPGKRPTLMQVIRVQATVYRSDRDPDRTNLFDFYWGIAFLSPKLL